MVGAAVLLASTFGALSAQSALAAGKGAAAPASIVVPATGGSAAGVALTDGSLYNVVDQIGVRALWAKGFTGRGVNVALIDTGVAPVAALSGADKVVATVDLSFEAGIPEVAYLDTFGHGTHMAGIIAGRDPGADPKLAAQHPEWFLGVAPDAGLVSVKVGDNSGAVDVTQVIAGVDWVVEHAAELNIRVINLSYGSNSTLPYTTDPLTAAVERAWKAGIVVVAAVGNDGRDARALATPAADPYVIAVSAAERRDSASVNNGSVVKRWAVPTWANGGNGVRNPDVTAPGASIVSLRDPGSRVDVQHPEGYVSPTLFKGSGSSQATAVVSGLVAVLLSAQPTMTPDQIKGSLLASANADFIMPKNDRFSGRGLVTSNLVKLKEFAAQAKVSQKWPMSTGAGSLEAARGNQDLIVNGVTITGDVTANGALWTGAKWTGVRWADGSWDGAKWTDGSWCGAKWTGAKWTGAKWTDESWSGAKWTDSGWTGAKWTDGSWSGAKWTGAKWTGAKWTDGSWDGAKWTGASWM